MTNQEKFFTQFKFNPERTGFVGIEREQFTLDPKTGLIVPSSAQYLEYLNKLNGAIDVNRFNFGYELSACQLESKIGPCEITSVKDNLCECDSILRSVDALLSLSRVNWELAPESIPLDIYPDPTGRYQEITRGMPAEVLSAACRVAATHIHIGMPNISAAIGAYNNAIRHVNNLIRMGDGSSGARMKLYQMMAKRSHPTPLRSADDLYDDALVHGFVDDPRQCWTLIRISVHGTIEFRMFGATDSIERIVSWVHECHKLCF